ncbi:protein piccolo-like [Choloepus didactylus]|uniref:protein piccolo-like n=1 Tax=Choloepus didactylus TaxID=27675 RepID=UPI0018A0E184|nr:protein piccolo-like [Choloepus didactylus]
MGAGPLLLSADVWTDRRTLAAGDTQTPSQMQAGGTEPSFSPFGGLRTRRTFPTSVSAAGSQGQASKVGLYQDARIQVPAPQLPQIQAPSPSCLRPMTPSSLRPMPQPPPPSDSEVKASSPSYPFLGISGLSFNHPVAQASWPQESRSMIPSSFWNPQIQALRLFFSSSVSLSPWLPDLGDGGNRSPSSMLRGESQTPN